MSKKQQRTYRSLRETAFTKAMKVVHKYIFNSAHNFAVGELIYKFENIVHWDNQQYNIAQLTKQLMTS